MLAQPSCLRKGTINVELAESHPGRLSRAGRESVRLCPDAAVVNALFAATTFLTMRALGAGFALPAIAFLRYAAIARPSLHDVVLYTGEGSSGIRPREPDALR